MFAHLDSLTFLTLSNNNIQFVASRVFGYSPNLQQLSLANNNIAFIANNEFHDFKSLVLLSLLNNKLSYIDPNFAKGSTKLQKICLGSNLFSNGFNINTSEFTNLNTFAIFSPTCASS
jgi:Leucine-rich repeat (LRR) protein